jgi:endoglucanase
MIPQKQRAAHRSWLSALTAIPTAAGREQRVVAWIEAWVAKRKRGLAVRRDRSGNLVISCRKRGGGAAARPIYFTAHLDHPAFVVREVRDSRTLELEFRGSVHDPYFENARIEVFDAAGDVHPAHVVALDAGAQPFRRVVARLARPAPRVAPGDVGRWRFPRELPIVRGDRIETHACDDLAGAAAALAAIDVLRSAPDAGHVGVLFTRAEEIGFVGAIAACRNGTVPRTARLICLENSRSFGDSPIGAGPIVRVGDRLSVFDPALTNRVAAVMEVHARAHPEFRWQRKLMPGGTCEATAFAAYGWSSTCLCLPLGNYHNMVDIDGVVGGKRPARVGPEFVSLADFHGLIEMLVVLATEIDSAAVPPIEERLDGLYARGEHVLA